MFPSATAIRSCALACILFLVGEQGFQRHLGGTYVGLCCMADFDVNHKMRNPSLSAHTSANVASIQRRNKAPTC